MTYSRFVMYRKLSAVLSVVLALCIQHASGQQSSNFRSAEMAFFSDPLNGTHSTNALLMPGVADPGDPSSAPPSISPVQSTVKVDAGPDLLRSGVSTPYHITQGDVLSSAGTWQDFTRYLQIMPGVVWNTDVSNDVIVRGGHPSENLYVVDGIEVPNINHISFEGSTGGFTSMLDTSLVGSVDMKAGVYEPKYSSRLSSLIEIQTREPHPAEPRRELTVGISGIGGLAEVPFGKSGKGNAVLSAHRSVLNWMTTDIGINGVPVYADGLATFRLSPTEKDRISVLSLTGADSIDIKPNPCDSGATSSVQMEYGGDRSTSGLTWQHVHNPTFVSTVTASYSYQSQDISQQQQSANIRQGYTHCMSLPYQTTSLYNERTSDAVSSFSYGAQFGNKVWLFSLGETGRVTRYRYTIAEPMGQQSPFSTNPAWTDSDNFARDLYAGETASYAEATAHAGGRWTAIAGVRLETFALTGAHMFEPRGTLSFRINRHQAIDAAFGRTAQLAPTINILSYAQNAHLRPLQVDQYSIGSELWRADRWSIGLQAYHKSYSNEPVSTQYPTLMLANMVDTLGQQFVWLPLTSGGRGHSEGVEMLLRARLPRLQFLASTTYARTWYAAADGVMRPGNYDLPFVSNIAGAIRLPFKMQISLRNTYATGRPYTPFNIALSEKQSRGIYDLTNVNAMRGPAYNRLDVDLNRNFRLPKGNLVVHGGVENALDRQNFLGYAWEASCPAPYRRCGTNVNAMPHVPETELTQMPLFPSASAQYVF